MLRRRARPLLTSGMAMHRPITRRNMLAAVLAMSWVRTARPTHARAPIFPDLASDVAALDAVRLSDRWIDWRATRPTHSLPPHAGRSAE